ncbi:MAG: four helix bundle protein [Planctomycetota bacterium]
MGEGVRHFTDLRVWRMAHRLFLDLCGDLGEGGGSLPGSVIAEQLLRSVGSVGANIAEGSNRTQRKFANSLDIALGEANETQNWLYKPRDAEVLPEEAASPHIRTVLDIEKMLASLRTRILENPDAAREPEPDYAVPDEDRPQ